MAWQFDVNSASNSTGVIVLFRLLTLLLAQGWTVPQSSDGTTVSNTNRIASSAILGTTKAWFRLKHPAVGSTREFVVQCITPGTSTFRLKYSVAGFTAGSPSATQVPSAADEQVLLGAGTDAAPTGATFGAPDGSCKQQIVAGQAAENYSFGLFGWTNGATNDTACLWIFDAMISGITQGADADPYAHSVSSQVGSGGPVYKYWVKYGLSGATFVTSSGSNMLTVPVIQDPYTGGDLLFPLFLKDATFGYKGMSTFVRQGGGTRTLCDTTTQITSRDHVAINSGTGNIWFPWGGAVPLF